MHLTDREKRSTLKPIQDDDLVEADADAEEIRIHKRTGGIGQKEQRR